MPLRSLALALIAASAASAQPAAPLTPGTVRSGTLAADGPVGPGAQTTTLDAGRLATGVYVLRLQTESATLSRTLTVVR